MAGPPVRSIFWSGSRLTSIARGTRYTPTATTPSYSGVVVDDADCGLAILQTKVKRVDTVSGILSSGSITAGTLMKRGSHGRYAQSEEGYASSDRRVRMARDGRHHYRPWRRARRWVGYCAGRHHEHRRQ